MDVCVLVYGYYEVNRNFKQWDKKLRIPYTHASIRFIAYFQIQVFVSLPPPFDFYLLFGLTQNTLYSLLAFDSSHNAIPVAWIISSFSHGDNIHKWVPSLIERIRGKDTRWKPNAVLVDDPSFQLSVLRYVINMQIFI